MPTAFETLANFESLYYFKYSAQAADVWSYLVWQLTQPRETSDQSLRLLEELFEYHRPLWNQELSPGVTRETLLKPLVGHSIRWRVWILPTDIDTTTKDKPTENIALLELAALIDDQLIDVVTDTFGPMDDGYYTFVELGNANEGLILMNDGSWYPVKPQPGLPDVISDELKQLEEGFIFIEVDNAGLIDIHSPEAENVDIDVCWLEQSYGPHDAAAVIGGAFDKAYEMMEEALERHPRYADSRRDAQEDAQRYHPNDEERAYERYRTLMTESLHGNQFVLSPLEAAGFMVKETNTRSGIEEAPVIDGEEVVADARPQYGNKAGTLVAFSKEHHRWEVWDAREQRPGSKTPARHETWFRPRPGDQPQVETTGHAGYIPNWLRAELISARHTTPNANPSPIVRAPEYRLRLIDGDRMFWRKETFYSTDAAEEFGEQWRADQDQRQAMREHDDIRYDIERIR